MASLLSRLPAPVHSGGGEEAPAAAPAGAGALARVGGPPPPAYGSRQGWVPRKPSDFADGGAYPECHVAQYPLECGRKGASGGAGGAKSSTVAVTVKEDGSVDYSALVKQGSNANKAVATAHSALVPKLHDMTEEDLARPEQEVVDATLAATKAVIEARVNGTLAANQPKSLPAQPGAPQYIKYTPAKQGPEYNSGASHRIIKMHTVAVDPMQPPKFAHKKVPRGPGSPPVPVMHSPPRPVSAKDQADWKIPACISNWKNSKGYTIPLDKRLAADGRGLIETQINDGFAKLSEALYVAESRAREAVETRAKIQRELLAKEKDRKEDELRQLAMAARLARGGVAAPPLGAASAASLPPPPPLPAGMSRPRAMDFEGDDAAAHGAPPGGYPPPPPMPPPGGYPPPPPRGGGRDGDASDSDGPGGLYAPEVPGESETAAEKAARLRRDEIREERRRERERERRLEARDAHGGKRSKLTRDRDRDVSERIALGQAAVGGARGAESMYDQRLFNQDAGIDSGFGPDDGYNTFSKPLFADRGNSLYQPGRGGAAGDAEVYGGEAAAPPGGGEEGGDDALRGARFKPDRGFAGAEAGPAGARAGGGRVGGPVAFERPPEDDDPFGLGQFITDVRKGGGGGDKAAPGRPGAMAAAAGGGDGAPSGRNRVDFQSGGR